MVAVPSVTEVTSPADDTVAIDESDVAQATTASVIVLLFPSLTVATSDAVSLNDAKLKLVGERSMVAGA